MSEHKQLKRIGRTLGQSAIASMIDSNNHSRVFTLKSGQAATFVRQLIPHDNIEERTFIDPQINGRDQATLTEESVKDISRTITLQQFFPAIGRMREGRIEIMDGSRRRAACLFRVPVLRCWSQQMRLASVMHASWRLIFKPRRNITCANSVCDSC